MKTIKMLVATVVAMLFSVCAWAGPTARAELSSDDTTLRFVYDDSTPSGVEGTDWFSVEMAELRDPSDEPPWTVRKSNVTEVVFDSSFADYRPRHCGSWFHSFMKLETIKGLDFLNTSEATSLAWMFNQCPMLRRLDLSSFDTANVTDMRFMFASSGSLTTIYATDKFVTTQVEKGASMFANCGALTGGYGTMYSPSSPNDQTNACIDSSEHPGYFTAAPVAVLSNDGGTLAFYADGASREGTVYSMIRVADLSPDDDMPWYNNYSRAHRNIARVVFDVSFAEYRPNHCGSWFYDFAGLEKVENIRYLNGTDISSMVCMFAFCTSLVDLDLSGLCTPSVTDMEGMFSGCTSLKTIFASVNFMVTQVTRSNGMFSNCTELLGGDGTAFDSANVDKTYARIDQPGNPGYFSLPRIARAQLSSDRTTFTFVYDSNTPSGVKGTDWFAIADAEEVPPDRTPLWYGARRTVTKVVFEPSFADYLPKHCGNWFYEFDALREIEDIGNLDTSMASSMCSMFESCGALQELDVSGFDTANVENMSSMFKGCSSLASLDVSGLVTAKVTDMERMFAQCSSLMSLDVSGFDTAQVMNMSEMFAECSSLASLDVSGFDTAQVTEMAGMFSGCSSLASLDVSGLVTANVTDMNEMFSGCASLASLNLLGFDTAKVEDMSGMFYGCASLEKLNLVAFDTRSLTKMSSMFYDCSNLKTIYAPDFDLSRLWSGYDREVFSGCVALVGGNGTEFDAAHADGEYARVDVAGAPGYFTPGPRTVTLDAAGGTVSPATLTPMVDTAIGTLPTPTRDGYGFDGWFTAAEGGAPVTAETLVSVDMTIYAHWTELPPPVTPPVTPPADPTPPPVTPPADPTPAPVTPPADPTPAPVDPTPVDPTPVDPTPVDPTPVDPTPVGPTPEDISNPTDVNYDPTSPVFIPPELYENKASTDFVGNVQYLGWVRDANGALKGLVLIKAAKEKKSDHTSKLSVTYTPLGGKKTTIKNFSPVNPVVGGRPEVAIPDIGTVTIGDDSFASADGRVQVGQDFTKSKNKLVKAQSLSRMAGKMGVYTFALGLNGKFAGFTVTVDKKGKGKLVGVLPDGTKVSLASQGVLGDGALAIPFVFSKKGSFGLIFWVNDDGTLGVSDLTAFKDAAGRVQALTWHGISGSHELAAGNHMINAEVDAGEPQSFVVANGKWVFPKRDDNPWGWKMSFKAKDGSAKGSFTSVGAAGKVKYTVSGAVVGHTFYGTAYNKKVGAFPVIAE